MNAQDLYCVAVISLPDSHTRRRLVTENFQELNANWFFFDASRQPPSSPKYSEQRAIVIKGRRLLPAELGNAASHLACLHRFSSESTYKYQVVIEDDVIIDPNFDIKPLLNLMKNTNIEYVRLYSHTFPPHSKLGKLGHRQFVRFKDRPLGTQAYVVSKKGAERIVASMVELDRPIDDHIDRHWISNVPPYALLPYPTLERSLTSTILSDRSSVKERSSHHKIARLLNRVNDIVLKSVEDIRLSFVDRKIRQLIKGKGSSF